MKKIQLAVQQPEAERECV